VRGDARAGRKGFGIGLTGGDLQRLVARDRERKGGDRAIDVQASAPALGFGRIFVFLVRERWNGSTRSSLLLVNALDILGERPRAGRLWHLD